MSVSIAASPLRPADATTQRPAVKIWDSANYRELLTFEGQGSEFWDTRFSPDGNLLGSLNLDGVLHLWRAPSWAEIEEAEAKEKAEGKQP